MNPSLLTVYKSPFQKKRIGRDNDGGYIISDIPDVKYDLLIACGVADDISFEEHFLSIYKDITCMAYDGTPSCIVNNSENNNIIFINKNIDTYEHANGTNLFDVIETHDNIFLKMDIEGYELSWIRCLSDNHLNRFSQIVIEFHFPFREEDSLVFEKLNKNHILVHFHGNNCIAGIANHLNILIPNVFECTYIHKKYVNMDTICLNNEIIPSEIDMPNCEGNDIYIDYPPFVFA